MGKSKNEIIFRISEFAIIQFLFKILMLAWIVFAIFKMNLNPTFFSLTIIVALFFLSTMTETSFILKPSELIIVKSRWLWILNRSTIIKLTEIKDIEIEKGEFDKVSFLLNLVEYIPGTVKKDNKYIITLADNTIKEYSCVGIERENKNLIDLIKKLKREG